MESIIDKDHVSPEALDPDKHETEEQSTDRRMNEIANKAAAKGMDRQQQEDRSIFTK
jgi:hypothetical protein